MGEQVAASTKKEKRESFSERTAWSGPCNLNQQGSAVQITGFTSDQSKGESSCVLMADKTSVRNRKRKHHGHEKVTPWSLSSPCRLAKCPGVRLH